jgi:predicted DNA-binding transcriptional regulator YafY
MSVVFRYGENMRASRLLSILILLQLRKRLTAQDLAQEFEVSVRTIYRDIDALSAAGVPVYGDKGPGGGFQLLDGYRTRLTGLDADEAEAMLLIGLPGEARAMGLGNAAARARGKLLAALSAPGNADANRIADRFHLDTSDWYRIARPTPFLATIARATLDGRKLAMTYQSWRACTDWVVEPWGLILKAGSWYLAAHSNGKTRIFSIADVQELDILADRFERPAGFDLADWWATSTQAFEARLRPGRAQLRASPLGLQRLRLLGAFAADAVKEAGPADSQGWRPLELPLESIPSAAPMLLGIGPEIDILDPLPLRAAVAELAQQVADRLKGEAS